MKTNQLLKGIVKFWDPRAQRGVIESDGTDYYMSAASLLKGFTRPTTGMVVLFRKANRCPVPAACQVLEAA